jgi:hypothetical protein
LACSLVACLEILSLSQIRRRKFQRVTTYGCWQELDTEHAMEAPALSQYTAIHWGCTYFNYVLDAINPYSGRPLMKTFVNLVFGWTNIGILCVFLPPLQKRGPYGETDGFSVQSSDIGRGWLSECCLKKMVWVAILLYIFVFDKLETLFIDLYIHTHTHALTHIHNYRMMEW